MWCLCDGLFHVFAQLLRRSSGQVAQSWRSRRWSVSSPSGIFRGTTIVMVAKCPQCGRLPIQARNELTLLKLAEAGKITCTCSWCAGLRWTDVHFGASELDRERYLLVQRNYDRRWSRAMLTPKNHKARRVDMSRELRRVLWTLRNQRSLEKAGRDFSDDLIFPSEAGTPIEMNNFAQRVFGRFSNAPGSVGF